MILRVLVAQYINSKFLFYQFSFDSVFMNLIDTIVCFIIICAGQEILEDTLNMLQCIENRDVTD